MKCRKYWRLLCLLPLICFFGSCSDSDDVGDSYKTFEGETIKDFLDNNPDYSEFRTALDTVDVLPLMSSYGKYTCFVPSNEAVERYVKEKGFSSFSTFLDSAEAVRQMVYFQIIDGESNGVGTYLTTSFTNGNIATKNMAGRYVYTTLADDGVTWLVNSNSHIISADNILVNGVVHVVDEVVQANQDLLSTFILENPKFQLYAEALKATGLKDSLSKVEDDAYVRPTGSTLYPKSRVYGYTALLESDSVLNLNGISSLDDMRRYAEDKYPDGKGLADEDRESSLNKFVSYHLLDRKLTSSQLCPTRDMTVTWTWEDINWLRETFRDGKFRLDNYLFPMASNTVIYVQKFVWRGEAEQTPVFNDSRNPYDAKYVNMNNEESGIVTIDPLNSDQDCLNGIIHSLTGMLYYREDVYHHRIRMDFTMFFPEMWNNSLITSGHIIPYGYFSNLKYEDKDGVTVNYNVHWGTHSFYLGDTYAIKGLNTYELEIGPVPSGSYEVRIGYHVRQNDFGVVQYYLDGEPCGIPLDQTVSANRGSDIGWNQTWFYLYGGVEQDPIAWTSGKETEDDYYGYDNDKAMHNLGYMKAPDSYTGIELSNGNASSPIHAGTARNDAYSVRRVLGMVTWSNTEKHTFTISNLMDRSFDLDYIEFMPKDLIEDEDTH